MVNKFVLTTPKAVQEREPRSSTEEKVDDSKWPLRSVPWERHCPGRKATYRVFDIDPDPHHLFELSQK
jgi:hypothetical protein